jgi:hypothetical protein
LAGALVVDPYFQMMLESNREKQRQSKHNSPVNNLKKAGEIDHSPTLWLFDL